MAAASTHMPGYQARDVEVVDYDMTALPGTMLQFRGPLPDDLSGGYIACLGAAQTLGCFCERPYPTLLAEELGLPALNLGYGGAGPEFFLRHPALIDYANRARLIVLQVTSARSQSNSHYECGGLEYVTLKDGRRMGAHAAFDELAIGPSFFDRLPLSRRLKRRMKDEFSIAGPRLRQVVHEVQEGWVNANIELLSALKPPVILLWFSVREPKYRQQYGSANKTLGEFPQLVGEEMIDRVRAHADGYAECVSRRGSPQPLVSRFTGEPVTVQPANDRPDLATPAWTTNHYYPSPEMHEDAAKAILGVIQEEPARYAAF